MKGKIMSFREKSAWAMLALFCFVGALYFLAVLKNGADMAPHGPWINLVILTVVGSTILMILLAVLTPKEAEAPADERERLIMQRAGHWSGLALSVGVVCGLGHFFFHANGNTLFNIIVGSLILASLVEFAGTIYLFRRGT
jgi:hypothetical protein